MDIHANLTGHEMANLSTSFVGIKSPNPFWLASAPPTDKAYNVVRAYQAGWGGVVWKTLGEDGPPIVNVNGPRYGAIWGADRRLLGLNNIELITDRPLEVNLREIKQVKRDWKDRALVVSLMVPCTEESWKAILKRVEETEADGVELNFGCPHGMAERGMGSAVGQVPEYIEMVTRWCKENTRMPVIVKLTPNIADIRKPAEAALRGGADGGPDQHHQLDHVGRSRPFCARTHARWQRHPWRLLRPCGQADRAQHGRRNRPQPRHARSADLGYRRRYHLARRGRVSGTWRRQRAGLHRGDDLRLQDRAGNDLGPVAIPRRKGDVAVRPYRPRGAERDRLAAPQSQLRHQGGDQRGRLHQVRAVLCRLRGHHAPGYFDERGSGVQGQGRGVRRLQPLRRRLPGGGLHHHARTRAGRGRQAHRSRRCALRQLDHAPEQPGAAPSTSGGRSPRAPGVFGQ